MNFFLYINRKLLLLFSFTTIFIFVIFIFTKQFSFENIELSKTKIKIANVDISEPKFTINNNSEKIYITAMEGNFINKNEILLNKNVKFKSDEFSIETEKVIFNRNKQSAFSETKSVFKSKNTIISAEGFDIFEKGNKIFFYGNSNIVLK